jgi:hypothetical protein
MRNSHQNGHIIEKKKASDRFTALTLYAPEAGSNQRPSD